MISLEQKKTLASKWFRDLRDKICAQFEAIETEYAAVNQKPNKLEIDPKNAKFRLKEWEREDGGGGEMSSMKGNVFEKVGVNISTVFGEFSPEFCSQIPGADKDPRFWATGVSLVAHMRSPLVPAVHFNTRFICTTKEWFGGGGDLNPMFEDQADTKEFHNAFKVACDKYDPEYYPKFKKWCDEYFFIKHRNQARGVGGIFYDYLDSDFAKNFAKNFDFTKDVGLAFLDIFPKLVRKNMLKKWNEEQREHQLIKRGLYTEFNLVYDRGTKFGLMTGGNTEAILMSLPPVAKWN
ncbi:MAG: coproporphyrinogen III oxidase [Rickettsiales bacterium]|jgi:coproporphyrinogen III oxidase